MADSRADAEGRLAVAVDADDPSVVKGAPQIRVEEGPHAFRRPPDVLPVFQLAVIIDLDNSREE